MSKFVIISDTCCDLGADIRGSLDIDYVKMPLTCNAEMVGRIDLDWKIFSPKGFYDDIRGGKHYKTSQINVADYIEAFEPYVKQGIDILSLTCSSGLSGSVNCSRLAKNELLETYPDAKIVCIDTLRGSLGEGLIVVTACQMREEGKSIDEIAEWIENHKLYVNQIGTVETLTYLQRAGRVTSTAAFFGNLLQVKPLIVSDAKGQNFVLSKVKGRKTSLDACVKYVVDNVVDPENQVLYMVHADCLADIEYVRDEILKQVKFKDVYINYVGPIIGSTVGPGMIGVYYYGKIQDLNK